MLQLSLLTRPGAHSHFSNGSKPSSRYETRRERQAALGIEREDHAWDYSTEERFDSNEVLEAVAEI
jgi:hypothetical protein